MCSKVVARQLATRHNVDLVTQAKFLGARTSALCSARRPVCSRPLSSASSLVHRTQSLCSLFNHNSKSSLSNKRSARRGNVDRRNKKTDGQVMAIASRKQKNLPKILTCAADSCPIPALQMELSKQVLSSMTNLASYTV